MACDNFVVYGPLKICDCRQRIINSFTTKLCVGDRLDADSESHKGSKLTTNKKASC